jgi:hypothetical protein
MSSPAFDFETAFLVGRATFLVFSFVIAAIAFNRWRRAAARDAERVTNQLTAVGDRLGEIEAGLALLDSRISEIGRQIEAPVAATPAPAQNASPSYPIAIRLARNGATVDELMESCGLGRQEAELVKRLHAPPKRGARMQNAAA